jgi:hypothetical protein
VTTPAGLCNFWHRLAPPMSEPNKETLRLQHAAPPLARVLPKPAAASVDHYASAPSGPRKETARVTIQPGVTPAPVLVERSSAAFDSIPKSYFWAIFGLAALIFLIQIWNYVVS